jgi:hypothetical protein
MYAKERTPSMKCAMRFFQPFRCFSCNAEEASSPAVVETEGVRFGLLGYSSIFWPNGMRATPGMPGISALAARTYYQPHRRTMEMPGVPPLISTEPVEEDLASMVESISRLKKEADIVMVSCHWGISSSCEIAEYQQQYGRAAIDAGANIVFGHHPHVIQPIEIWNGKPIFYSLGNFAFDWFKMRGRNQDGIIIKCSVAEKRITSIVIIPVSRNAENDIEPLSPMSVKGAEILQRLNELSKPYGTEISITEEYGARLPG